MLGREKKGEGCALNEEEEEKKNRARSPSVPSFGPFGFGVLGHGQAPRLPGTAP